MDHPMNDWSLPELCEHYFDIVNNFVNPDSPYRMHVPYSVVLEYLEFVNAIMQPKLPSSFRGGLLMN